LGGENAFGAWETVCGSFSDFFAPFRRPNIAGVEEKARATEDLLPLRQTPSKVPDKAQLCNTNIGSSAELASWVRLLEALYDIQCGFQKDIDPNVDLGMSTPLQTMSVVKDSVT
jgi:hypothetical protein